MLGWVSNKMAELPHTSPRPVTNELDWWNLYEDCISRGLSLVQVKELWSRDKISHAKKYELQVIKVFFVKIIALLKASSSRSGANHQQISIAATSLSVIIPRLTEEPDFDQSFFWDTSFSSDGKSSCGSELLDAIVALLLQPGFTFPAEEEVSLSTKPGPNSSLHIPGTTDAMILRQSELVNLLLVCVSTSLFITYDAYSETKHSWMAHLTNSEMCEPLFNYLLRMVFAYSVPQARLGFLRRNYQPQLQDSLARSCCHLWILLMNFGTDRIKNLKPQEVIDHSSEFLCNEWWKFLNDCDDDLTAWMSVQVKKNLENSLHNLRKKIPKADFSQEYLLALWILLTMHTGFYLNFGENEVTCLGILISLLERLSWMPAMESALPVEKSPRKVLPEFGTTNMLAFTLLVMSTRRAFAVSLNEPLPSSLPQLKLLKSNMKTHADLLVAVIHSVLSNELKHSMEGRVCSWCELLIIVLSNSSAFVKSFSLESAVMLVNLMERLVRLMHLPQARHQVNLLLGVFNNVLQYQYEGNASLLYVILRENAVFRKLIDTPLSTTSESQQTTPSDVPSLESPAVYKASSSSEKFHTEHIEKVLTYLLPKVEAHCQDQGLNNHGQVLEYLAKTTLVGILPVPHKILVRNFLSSKDAATWIISYVWGVIFMKNEFLEWLPYDTENVQMIVFHN
eukprot:Gregarina_sp_Pseudo_9__1833@NODE_224_length_3530_cov_15_940132_g208_i0_p1_GENE_NODE_224_length_3530_cov_15_940132_g208_i0NODE_224_length_3530_cov_15_940132_g208_i0_p1_ORF_typecomplete_len679_score97_43Hid1/PF12722_7/6_3e61Dymeclin/PF09742_9/8_8e57Phage_Coat_A/PF05357_13/0_29_NODE_224_length_3530_cov_15_940132_g208_i08682904